MLQWFFGGQKRQEENSLRDELRSIEGRMKALELEWDNTYHKLAKVIGRVTKTQALERSELPVKPDNNEDWTLNRDEVARRFYASQVRR